MVASYSKAELESKVMNITYTKSSQFPWLKGISKKRECRVIEATKVTFNGVNWSGGSDGALV